jgi:hypothetical protein
LRGNTLREALAVEQRQPARLGALYRRWSEQPDLMYRAPPSLAFAVLCQARADGYLAPEGEATVLGKLLTHWALVSTLDTSFTCASAPLRRLPTQNRLSRDLDTVNIIPRSIT